ncbi:MAG: hypothetical protein PHX49_05335 [Bacteroidales bacterium]|nr:hypothetical protein [Bacteroidales bacterium]
MTTHRTLGLFLALIPATLSLYTLRADTVSPDKTPVANKATVTLSDRINGLKQLMQENYPEKIYIQTDRPVYNLHDTIWYKVWVMQAGTLFPTEKSRLVYVDLINEENNITQSAQYTLNGGGANGQFILTKAIQDKGLYRIRAYTRWQKNFGDSLCFEKTIPIWGEKRKEEEQKNFVAVTNESNREVFLTQKQYQARLKKEEEKKQLQAQKRANRELELDLQFLPEGGKLIERVANRIAFKALYPDGRSVAVEGTIIDQEGNEVTTFASEHKGMGSFLLVPDSGKQYTARLFNDQKITLPLGEQEGVGLMVLSAPSADTLTIAVNATPGIVQNNTQFMLLTESRGVLSKEAFSLQINKPRVLVRIPKSKMETGVNRLTLFTTNGEPLCERLVYINKEDKLYFDVKAHWEILSDTVQKMTLKIRPQLNGANIPASFAMSVTNKNLVPVDSIQKTLCSEMFLSSELKGFIEEPGYYFNQPYDNISKQLDLVMLTHGWRGYDWDEATRRSFQYAPDTSFSISGQVVNLLNKPVEDRKISLFVQGGKTLADECKTNKEGRFAFTNLDVRETSMVRVKIEKEKSKKLIGLGIKLDTIFSKPSFPILATRDFLYEATAADSLLQTYKAAKEEDNSYLDSLRKSQGMHLLEGITVTETRKIKNSYNRSGSGVGDFVMDSVEIGRYDAYSNVIDVLKAEIPGFKKDNSSPRGEDGNLLFKQYDYYNIDGKPVYFQVDAEVINPDNSITSASAGAAEFTPSEASEVEAVSSSNAEDSEYGKTSRIDGVLQNIAGKEIRGIEVLTSRDNLANYDKKSQLPDDSGLKPVITALDSDYRPIAAIVVITTKAGKGPRENKPEMGTYFTKLNGGSVPRTFYVPKYYPSDPIDQIDYDQKQLFYWNPSLLTNGEREVEVTFPIGAYMKGNLRLEIEGSDLNGHIGTQRQEIKLN